MKEINLNELASKLASLETFVINIITDWCPDCTQRQRPHLPGFSKMLETSGIPFYQLKVQTERKVFLSEEHREMTEKFGGHGYPRTALVIRGIIPETSDIEVVTSEELEALARSFIRRVEENN